MDEKTSLTTFPSNAVEALAFMYVQQRGVAKLDPEQVVEEYERALKAMKLRHTALKNQK